MAAQGIASGMGGGITPSNTLIQGDYWGGAGTVYGYQSGGSGGANNTATIIAAVSIVAMVFLAVSVKGKK